MKKRIIGTITLLTITLSAFVYGDVKSDYKKTAQIVKPALKQNDFDISNNPASLSNSNRANLSQADGGE